MDTIGSDHSMGQEGIPVPCSSSVSAADLRKHVFIGLPWQKTTNPMTCFCIAAITDRRRTALSMVHGDAYVCHSRNKLADAFLDTGMEWMLMVDDDMLFPMGDANWYNAHTEFDLPPQYAGLHTLNRLLSHNKTVVGGLYFGRHRYGAPMYCEGANNPQEAAFARKAPHDLLKPTRWVATGCFLVHRQVFLDIEERFPRLARRNNRAGGQYFTPSEATAIDLVDRVRDMLSKGPMDGDKAMKAFQMLESGAAMARSESSLGMGEDVTLCRRAALSGHQPYVDMALVCGHLGAKCYGPRSTEPRPLK